jgi:predicted CXXCH cytochrome family protein
LLASALALAAALQSPPQRPLASPRGDYVGSNACRECHAKQFDSWRRTFHSTMTQLPTRASVLGRFDGTPVEFYGKRATPFERDGRFWLRLPGASGEREAEVALCVGSRRYQQYFELVGDAYRRLPILWHAGEQRWMHLNGVFLEPDDSNWDAHAATWNENCVFCHNTAPAPGLTLERDGEQVRKRFDSHVAELGIACEACHGPCAKHVARMSEPGAKEAAKDALLASELDVVQPKELAQREALSVCGQCHSQRLPSPRERLWQFLDSGPTFRPGNALTDHVAPITRDTPSVDERKPALFSDRFWRDGTARLTAYEYLGITQSPCFRGGDITCTSCHTMHGGDVHGQIEPRMRGDAACTQCHAEIARDVKAHTHHAPESAGSRCLECHMPRAIFGVVEIHRSHRIESPDVRRDVEAGRPNACTSCHLDRTAGWAADAMRGWWGEEYERPKSRPDGAPLDVPEAIASLHSGDAVQRAVYAWHFGRADAAGDAQQRSFALAHLAVALGDGYPSIRTLARRSMRALDGELELGLEPELAAFDTFAPLSERQKRVFAVLASVERACKQRGLAPSAAALLSNDSKLDLARVRALLDLQSDHVIAIGE